MAELRVRPKVHYHSDCPFFAGCENMLVNLWSSRELRAAFDVSFSYRASGVYTAGLEKRATLDFPVVALRFPDPSEVVPAPQWLPRWVRHAARFLSRLAFTIPLLILEIEMMRRVLKRISPDVLHINNGGYPAALSARAAAIAGRMVGVPCVIMVVNNLATDYGTPLRMLEFPLDRVVARSVTRFVTGSKAASSKLARVLSLTNGRCGAINNGLRMRETSETVEQTRRRLGLLVPGGVIFGVIGIMER